jgi:hypothetical protein
MENVGPYRAPENPHKKAYDRKQSLKRLAKSAPVTIRRQRQRIAWFESEIARREQSAATQQSVLVRMRQLLNFAATALMVALIALGGFWMRASELAQTNRAQALRIGRLTTRLELARNELDVTRDELISAESRAENFTRGLGACHRDLGDLRSRVDSALDRQRLTNLRIELLEFECGLR